MIGAVKQDDLARLTARQVPLVEDQVDHCVEGSRAAGQVSRNREWDLRAPDLAFAPNYPLSQRRFWNQNRCGNFTSRQATSKSQRVWDQAAYDWLDETLASLPEA